MKTFTDQKQTFAYALQDSWSEKNCKESAKAFFLGQPFNKKLLGRAPQGEPLKCRWRNTVITLRMQIKSRKGLERTSIVQELFKK